MGWQIKLNRTFGHSENLARVLEGATQPVAVDHLPEASQKALQNGDLDGLGGGDLKVYDRARPF